MSLDRFASIAAERPELEEDVEGLRVVLASQLIGVPVRVKRVADLLDVNDDEAEHLLSLLVPDVLVEQARPLCLSCDSLIEPDGHDNESLECDLCGEAGSAQASVKERCFYLKAPVSLLHRTIYSRKTYETTMTDTLNDSEQCNLASITPWTEPRESDYCMTATSIEKGDYERIGESLQRWGICHITWAGMTPDHDRLRSLADGLGPACKTQNDFVGDIKSIEPKVGVAANSGDSAAELGFHVDGTQHEETPALLVFQYDRAPQHGGFSTFVDMAQVLAEFEPDRRAYLLTTLARSDCATFEKKGMKVIKPIIRAVHGGRSVACRLRFDGDGDRVCTVNPECVEAFEEVREAVMRDRDILVIKPAEGDIIIFDNWRLLHGRRGVGGRYQRIHDRMWIQDLNNAMRPRFAMGVRPLEHALMASIQQANAMGCS